MNEVTRRKLAEILRKAQYLHASFEAENEKILTADRACVLVSEYNRLIGSQQLEVSTVQALRTWSGGSPGGNLFAHKTDITGSLPEIFAAIESPPEMKVSPHHQCANIIELIRLGKTKLRKVIRDKPSDEKEVQDAFEGLLVGADVTHSREADRIEYSSKTYTPDFSFPTLDVALEIKLCGSQQREKQIIAEINDDIQAYRTKYANLVFLIYDLGFIRDTDRFASSFEEIPNVFVTVVKH